jgi:hypothetical protein
MNIYLISQAINNDFDTYRAAVVVAWNSTAARFTHPDGRMTWDNDKMEWIFINSDDTPNEWDIRTWIQDPSLVKAEHIGSIDDQANGDTTPRVILASFHAG